MHPIPVIFISISTEIISSFQWHAWFAKLLPCSSFSFRSTHMHRISYLAYHTCFASCCLCISRDWLWFRLLVLLFWVEPGDEFVKEEPVEYAYEDQAFDNSENLAGKMITPRNHFYLCFASCSLYCHARYLSLAISCLLFLAMSASNHPLLANRCLAKLPLLLSPSYSVASCRWSWSWFHVGAWIFWISQYLLFN